MKTMLVGRAVIVGDNVDTDQIYPGCYLALTDPNEIGSHCMEGISKKFSENFPTGGIVVAGRNFGCGSSREHAPIALINMGAAAVLADSFARIFFRNAVNLGLIPIVCPGISQQAKDGQTLILDLEKGIVTIQETNEILHCEQLGDQAMMILQAGGIKPLIRKRLNKE